MVIFAILKKSLMMIKLAIVGITGLVGSTIVKVLKERFGDEVQYIPVASARSVGKSITISKQQLKIISVEEAIVLSPHIVIFSAGSEISLQVAPLFAEKGTFVIDNSSAWRMYPEIPLTVPEINGNNLTVHNKIIANPNCSTIQLVMALYPLHKRYGIKRLVISTYQSVTGTGVKAVTQLQQERKGAEVERVYSHPIDLNIFPHGGYFDNEGNTSEELKLVNETRKILADDTIQITATVVRVPVFGGHSEAVNVELKEDFNLDDIRSLLQAMQGVIVIDNPTRNEYPTPLYAQGKDEVFVGRLRKDLSQKNSLNMWIVSDNLRKGAATNAVQIAELIRERFL